MICVATTTIVVSPSVVRGLTRMYANAAFKMSLRPSGRSGMTPGFSARGGRRGDIRGRASSQAADSRAKARRAVRTRAAG